MSFPVSITFQVSTPPTGAFDSLAKSAGQLDQALMSSAGNFDRFGQSVSQMEGPLSGVSGSMGQLEGSMSGLEGSLGGAAGSMGEFAGATGELNGAIGETGGFVSEASGSMSELSGATSETGGAMTELSGTTTETGGAMTELSGTTTETGGAMTELQTSATDTGTSMTDLSTATGETNTVLTDTSTVLSDTAPIMAETGTATTDLAQGFTDLAPPVETSNTALSDTVPILEGAGTAADEATTSTDSFSGALGGLSTEIEPVNGGLTDTSTLVGDVGLSADTTSGQTSNLNQTMVGLGTGIGTVTGSAMSMFSAFTNVRDAQAGVDKANIKVIDTNTKLDTSINTLNRSLNKIVADTQNQISGQERLAAAQAKFNALVEAGVRSGPQFSAALAELRAAQDGLSSSTVKGNEMIAKAGPLIDKVETSSRKATSALLGQTRATEGLAESYLGIAGSLVAGVSGFVQIATQGGTALKVLGPMKGVIAGIGTTLTTTLIPALGAIAVPAAIAVAAIGAFIGAVEAIRANIGVFDELGVSIGNVFPQLRTFLDDARQAFINFSDGLNTGISMLLGAFDSLTGGVLGAQKAWDGFTGTLPKGTGEMGLAANAANLWTLSMTNAANETKVGAGKWKEADGVLMRLNGSVLAAAGTWDRLGDGTAVYLKQAEKVPPVQEQATQSTTQMSEATKKAADELAKVGTAVEEANAKIVFYSDANKMAELTAASFALGVANAKTELIDKTAKLAEGAGALQTYSQQLADGSIQALAYKEGILEAAMAFVEQTRALEQARGAFDANNQLMAEGKLQALDFATGLQDTRTAVQEATREVVTMAGQLEAFSDAATRSQADNAALMKGFIEQQQALSDLYTQFAEATGAAEALRMELGNSENAVLRFNTGMAEGRKSALEFLAGLQETRGEAVGFRSELLSVATAVTGGMSDMSRKSTEALQQIIEVAAGVPGAFEKVVSGLDKMGQKIIDSLAKAGKEGKDAFSENIDKLEQELRAKFSEPLRRELQIQTNIQQVQTEIEGLMGVLAATLRDKPLEVALETQAAQDAMSLLIQRVDEAAAMSPKFQPLQTALNNLAAWSPSQGLDRLPLLLTDVLQGAQAMEGGMQGAITAFDSMFTSVAQTQSGLDALKSAFESVGLSFDTTTGKITDASGKILADLQVMGEGATTSAATTVAALDTLGPAGTAARTTLAFELVGLEFLMNNFAQEVKQSAIEVSTAFANMATNTGTSLNTMASGIIIFIAAFAKIGSSSQSMASTVSGSFSNMAANTRASMNTIASGITIIIASFTRMGTDAQRGATTVGTAFTTMGSRVTSATNTARSAVTTFTSAVTTMASTGASRASSFASSFASAMSRVSSSASSAASSVRSLQSAINSLKSKTVVITTIHRQVIQRVYAAQGGAFIASSPTKVGPLNVSEFGQQELVTVTPLQNPGGQTITGPGMQVSTSGPGAKAFAKSGDQSISLGDIADMLVQTIEKGNKGKPKQQIIRELPIKVYVGDKLLLDIISRRLFEMSDALI